MSNRKFFAAIALTAGFVTCALQAPVASAEQTAATRVVAYADLDLGTAAGAAALYERLRLAAREVCGEPVRSAAALLLQTKCRRKALSEAVQAIDARTLTALHRDSGCSTG